MHKVWKHLLAVLYSVALSRDIQHFHKADGVVLRQKSLGFGEVR